MLFAQRHTERIAQMANHLRSGHAAPTPLAVGAHLAQAIQHFLLVAIIQEGSHLLDVHSTPGQNSSAELRYRLRNGGRATVVDFVFFASLPLQSEFTAMVGQTISHYRIAENLDRLPCMRCASRAGGAWV